MATYYSVRNGDLSLGTINNSFGLSLSSLEVINSNTTDSLLLTSFQTSPTLIVNQPISALYVALNTNNRNSNPSGTLDLTVTDTVNNFTSIDSSPNKFILARGGNPFNTALTPYHPNGWSGYFNGSTSFLLVSPNTALAIGTGDFTLECWVYRNAINTYSTILEINNHSLNTGVAFFTDNNSNSTPTVYSNAFFSPTNVASLSVGRWHHIAYVRQSGNLKIYVNGIGSSSIAFGNNISTVTNFSIGYANGFNAGSTYVLNGYISNFRLVKGQALYTTNFTPPTANFGLTDNGGAVGATATPILSNVALLTLQNNTFKDNSTNNFSISSLGTPSPTINQISPFTPKAYIPSIHSGSILFNGVNTSLSTPNNFAFNFGTGDFSIEWWMYLTVPWNTMTNPGIVGQKQGDGTSGWQIYRNSAISPTEVNIRIVGQNDYRSNAVPLVGVWEHYAVTRQSGTLRWFKNGVLTITHNNVTGNIVDTTGTFNVGFTQTWSGYFNGYLSNIRIVKGQALYTTNFTPPTANLGLTDNGGAIGATTTPVLSNVSLLINNNNGVTTSTSQSYPISSFTTSNNWNLLKLPNQLSANNSERVNVAVKTSQPNQLSVRSNFSGLTALDDTRNNSVSSISNTFTLSSVTIGGVTTNAFYLSGTTGNNWMTVPASPLFNFNDDFTIEFWVNTSVFTADIAARRIISFGLNANNNLELILYDGTGSSNKLSLWNNSNTLTGTSAIADGNWHHVAVTRYANTLKLFVDGGQSGNTTINSTTFNAGTANPMSIGAYGNSAQGRWQGYIANLRIIKDLAVYTQPFTVPSIQSVSATPETIFLLKDGTINNFNRMLINEPTSAVDYFFNAWVFNGTSSFLNVSSNAVSNLTGNFTMEAWIFPRTAASQTIFHLNAGSTLGTNTWIDTSRRLVVDDGNNPQTAFTGSTVNTNQWNHIAIVRNGNTTFGYINGLLAGSNSYTPAINTNVNIGAYNSGPTTKTQYFNGAIANVRIVKGQALYTTNFAPPAANLGLTDNGGAIPSISPVSSNVCLLTLQDSILKDNSTFSNTVNSNFVTIPIPNLNINTNYTDLYVGGLLSGSNVENRTITADNFVLSSFSINNNSSVNFPLTSNKTLTINGSAGLQINSGGTLNIGTSSNPILSSTTHTILLNNTNFTVAQDGILNIYGSNKTPYSYLSVDSPASTGRFISSQNLSSNWLSGDNILFTNNISGLSTFDSLTLSAFENSNTFRTTGNASFFHNSLSSNPYIPSISNLTRNVRLSGIGNSNIIIDGGNDNITNTQFNNINFYLNNKTLLNSNILNNVFNVGKFSTTKPNYYFNGSASLVTAFTSGLGFGTGDFTIDGWLYLVASNSNSNGCIIDFRNGGNLTFPVFYINSGNLTYYINNAIQITGSTVPIQRWVHVAACRSSGSTKIFINGVQTGSTYSDSINAGASSSASIGRTHEAAISLNGYISNLRVVKGQALYTTNFTPPTTDFGLTDNGGAIGAATPVLSNVSLLTLQDYIIKDSSFNNVIITNNNVISDFSIEPPFKNNTNNINVNNNIFYRNNISFGNLNLRNFNLTNNLILSNINTGLILSNLSCTDVTMSGNYVAGLAGVGALMQNCSGTGTLVGASIFNGTRNVVISGNNSINVGNIIAVSGRQEGVYVDASTSNLSATSFQNIIASNNSSVGFRVSGNNLNYLTPITLNINGLTANNNLSAGFEAYNITGNLSNITVNDNDLNDTIISNINTSIGSGRTEFNRLTSIINIINVINPISSKSVNLFNILSGYNYSEFIINNALLSTNPNPLGLSSAAGITLDSTRFSKFCLNNSTISATTPIIINTTRNILEGSYLFNNNNLGSINFIDLNKYQPNVYKTTGFGFTNYNRISGNNFSYLPTGLRLRDTIIYDINSSDLVSERLIPTSRNSKLRSSSKFVALNIADITTISTKVLVSSAYNGNPPRLILKRNTSAGISSDIVLAIFDLSFRDEFFMLNSTTSSVTNNCVLEFYIDCDGSSGYVCVDSWAAN